MFVRLYLYPKTMDLAERLYFSHVYANIAERLCQGGLFSARLPHETGTINLQAEPNLRHISRAAAAADALWKSNETITRAKG